MDKAKEMILADALDVAIKQTKKVIKLKRAVIVLSLVCGALSCICVARR